MKLIFLFLIILFSNVLTEKNEIKSDGEIIGEVYTLAGQPSSPALTYGLAKIPHPSSLDGDYIMPEMVTHLPDVISPPKKGPLETVDEIPTEKEYYKGENKLNIQKINCRIYANPTDCLHQSSCGWCGNYSACIMGNGFGPLQPCNKSTFIYSSTGMGVGIGWEQNTRRINEQVGNVSLTVATN